MSDSHTTNAKKTFRVKGKVPDLTIITVCMQAAPGLKKTVLSVLAEKAAHWEYIVVDGGSTDGTLDILKQYRGGITKSISEADHGVYHAMNKGIALARGRWLLFLNAGDTLRPGILARLLASAKDASPDTGLVCGRVAMLDAQGRSLGYTFPAKMGDSASIIRNNCVAHPATLIRRSTFERNGLFSQACSIAGDYEFWVRLRKSGVVFLFVEHIVVDMPNDGLSAKRSLYLKAQQECLLILVQYGYLSLTAATARFLRLRIVFFLKNAVRACFGDRRSQAISLARAQTKGRRALLPTLVVDRFALTGAATRPPAARS